MKNKVIKIINIIGLVILGAVILCALFYMYDMYNGKVEKISFYDDLQELKKSEVLGGDFESVMQEIFEKSGIERQVEPITTPQQVKKLAQKVFYKMGDIDALTIYRPYSVYHDDEAKMWAVYAYPGIFKNLPFIFGGGHALIVTDDGYIVATLFC